MQTTQMHTFHIPVMGLAYTVDTPIKVARFGIDSVISIIEDKLIELMRKHYYHESKRPYKEIRLGEPDYRANRITDYLNLVNTIVKEQVEKLRQSAFETGSDIVKYFEMLPGKNVLRLAYERMLAADNDLEKEAMLKYLRSQIHPGKIDVNIMTKVDKNNYDKKGDIIADSSDAVAALRGYANSNLTHSSIVFSAGLNPRLYNYLEKLAAFYAKGHGIFDKEVVIKVSDYRSALIQGKYLAKKGIWVSEFRIESGLNCGGHAFATDGTLLGPILEEFKTKKNELTEALHSLYQPAARSKGIPTFEDPHPIRITAQGGIGTFEEASFLTAYYNLDSTGWGTPFLLCPEATTVDANTLRKLSEAGEKDIILSKSSPLGIRFNYLKGTTAETERLSRVMKGKPGSPCTEKHLVSNTEFTADPICTASHSYQKKKIEQLQSLNLSQDEYTKQFNDVVSRECLCIGLINSAILKYQLPPIKKMEAVTICPGPNLAYFSNVVTLKEMTDHIYGRTNLIANKNRPHMFIKELILNIKYLEEQILDLTDKDVKTAKDLLDFSKNLLKGISYYRDLALHIPSDAGQFKDQLTSGENEINSLIIKLEKMCSVDSAAK
ncbi:MAG TPA: hypothetical protein PK325_07895 [Cyclobacteriaceae bacterium]|jgi:hypothetical protein|nr:hypothetical protein [Cyclobacteriaceae bacterium]HMV88526.1 hypothetical protein [Cyclobacteriaceae bacterium]HMX48777.1 hypothetical protein [Cyclobacteriaceae bacterium]HNC10190.1 hypothetical protein [Cyclobacteriaceae bacterium]HNC28731.1 hypothetical protein [Cyclobacteriaceae bacterium]